MSKESMSKEQEEILKAAYWDFDARVKGYAPYNTPYGNPEHAFVVSVLTALAKHGEAGK